MNRSDSSLPQMTNAVRSVCLLAAGFSSLFGVLIITSWFISFRASEILEGVPVFIASCFFLIGLAFLGFAFDRLKLVRVLAMGVVLCALITIVLGILNFIPISPGFSLYAMLQGDNTPALGFIRLSGGISSILIGVWFLKFPVIRHTTARVTLSLIIGSLLFGIGVFSITQQYLWIPLLGGSAYVSASVVALGQMVLGGLLLSLSYRDHVHLFARALWSWLLMPLGIVLLMGTLVMSHFLQKQQENRIASDMHSASSQLEAILDTFLTERVLFIQRFAYRLEENFNLNPNEPFVQEEGVRMFIGSHSDVIRVRWLYLDGRNIWTLIPAPLRPDVIEEKDVALMFLAQQPSLSKAATQPSLPILQTKNGFSLATPIRRGGKVASVLIFDFDSAAFLKTLPRAVLPDGYGIEIRDKQNSLLFSTPIKDKRELFAIGARSFSMEMQGLSFQLKMTPVPTNFSYQVFFLPWLVLLAGSTISLLLMWAYWLAQTTQLAQRESEKTNAALKEEIQHRSLVEQQLRLTQDELEVKIAERTEQLTRSNQELEQFAFIASHDLQEPVRKVANYLDLLVIHTKGTLNADAQRDVDRILKSVLHMKSLLSELMALLRVRHDNAPFEMVSLSDEVRNVLSGLDNVEGMQVRIDPLPMVPGNRLRLRQLFHNLLSNAVKFRGKDTPTVLVSAHQDQDKWVISVRDNGIGIEPEHKQRIFEIFQRLNPRAYPGSGMGLAICKRIIESHGGNIWVESTPGYGTTFKFTLPIHKEAAQPHYDEIIVG